MTDTKERNLLDLVHFGQPAIKQRKALSSSNNDTNVKQMTEETSKVQETSLLAQSSSCGSPGLHPHLAGPKTMQQSLDPLHEDTSAADQEIMVPKAVKVPGVKRKREEESVKGSTKKGEKRKKHKQSRKKPQCQKW